VEITLSFESLRAVRLSTGDPRAHRVLLLALAANGLETTADKIAEGSHRAIAVANQDRPALGRALASWFSEL
jgi:hypothetical protein